MYSAAHGQSAASASEYSHLLPDLSGRDVGELVRGLVGAHMLRLRREQHLLGVH